MKESELYLGTKLVCATPMTRQEYNDYRGWMMPPDEVGEEAGYLVEYLDGGKGNHPDHTGYISWSPQPQFETAYKYSGCFSFGHAIVLMKMGHKVSRRGWNGSGMFAWLNEGGEKITINEPNGDTVILTQRPHYMLKTAQDDVAIWVPSCSDTLADDWILVA